MRVLEKAIQFGHPVLLENITETLDPGLNPILQKAFIKSGRILMMVSYNYILAQLQECTNKCTFLYKCNAIITFVQKSLKQKIKKFS